MTWRVNHWVERVRAVKRGPVCANKESEGRVKNEWMEAKCGEELREKASTWKPVSLGPVQQAVARLTFGLGCLLQEGWLQYEGINLPKLRTTGNRPGECPAAPISPSSCPKASLLVRNIPESWQTQLWPSD